MATTGHWMDMGGNVPGGWAPKATEIHQEGIVIPPVKLYEDGQLNEALVAMFRANVRLPAADRGRPGGDEQRLHRRPARPRRAGRALRPRRRSPTASAR